MEKNVILEIPGKFCDLVLISFIFHLYSPFISWADGRTDDKPHQSKFQPVSTMQNRIPGNRNGKKSYSKCF